MRDLVSKSCQAPAPGTVAAVILLREDGAVLLQHRDAKPGLRRANQWVPPGGHCDPGEDTLSCARRELLEETGYQAGALHWLTTILDEPGEGWAPYPLHVYWGRYDGVQPVRCYEGQALAFIPRASAAAYLIPPCILDLWDQAAAAARIPADRRAASPYPLPPT
jgi:8-oxo-dGTP pyrophosphatase MutT (NUDIX family)